MVRNPKSGEAYFLQVLGICLFLLSAIPVPQASTVSNTVPRVIISSRHHHGPVPYLRLNEPIRDASRKFSSLSTRDHLTAGGVQPRRELVNFRVVVPDFYAYCYRDISKPTDGSCGNNSDSIGPVGTATNDGPSLNTFVFYPLITMAVDISLHSPPTTRPIHSPFSSTFPLSCLLPPHPSSSPHLIHCPHPSLIGFSH